MSFLKNFVTNRSLLKCLIMDAVGYFSYLLPGVAESFDVVWAPISAYVFFRTFGGGKGMLGGILNFIEEILPGTDFIPSFTIMYFLQKKEHANRQIRKTEDAEVLEIS